MKSSDFNHHSSLTHKSNP